MTMQCENAICSGISVRSLKGALGIIRLSPPSAQDRLVHSTSEEKKLYIYKKFFFTPWAHTTIPTHVHKAPPMPIKLRPQNLRVSIK